MGCKVSSEERLEMVDHNEPALFAEPGEFDLPEHLKHFGELLKELNKESARGCVLVACSYLDDMLEAILTSFFVEGRSGDLFSGFNAPLGPFATRATIAFALGLITQAEFDEIKRLKKIRNAFAHGVGTSFETDSIKGLSANLEMAAQKGMPARGAFTTAAVSVILKLTNRAAFVGRERRTVVEWPF